MEFDVVRAGDLEFRVYTALGAVRWEEVNTALHSSSEGLLADQQLIPAVVINAEQAAELARQLTSDVGYWVQVGKSGQVSVLQHGNYTWCPTPADSQEKHLIVGMLQKPNALLETDRDPA
ncbi:hypothetical protein ACN6AT_37175 (plasmid) [Streptomyces sp. JL4002]|uniref:hypothetical protein n=1 Tax=Streptomyces sp. JL4002 TaxID=3404781 RepID=UPI003B287275